MTEREKPAACYRDRDNGVRYIKAAHAIECNDPSCRGCKVCPEAKHCTARKGCSWHVPEQTCGRCINAARLDLRWIGDLASLMPTAAIADGVNSEAAMLAGPGANYATFSARRTIAKRWIFEHIPEGKWEAAFAGLLADDDEHHAHNVLTRWQMMIAEDYGHPLPERLNTTGAIGYLDRNLARIAQDETQDFPLLARELKKCRQHMESVLHNDTRPDRGAPCPACHDEGIAKPPRLTRVYAERWEADDDSRDQWTCPRSREHSWKEKDYRGWVEDRVTVARQDAG